MSGGKHNKMNRLSIDAPSRDVPSLSVFLPKCRQMMSRRDAVTSHDFMTSRHDVTWRLMSWQKGFVQSSIWSHHKNIRKSCFLNGDLDLWPMTLTLKLIRDFVKVNLSTKFGIRKSNGSVVSVLTNWGTHTQTNGTDFIPSTADAEGNYES